MTSEKKGKIQQGLQELAKEQFHLEGEVHRLVTFLNRTLKTRGLIFGISLAQEGRYLLTIYDEPSINYYHWERSCKGLNKETGVTGE